MLAASPLYKGIRPAAIAARASIAILARAIAQ